MLTFNGKAATLLIRGGSLGGGVCRLCKLKIPVLVKLWIGLKRSWLKGTKEKMLESRPEDALGSLVETVETVDCRDCSYRSYCSYCLYCLYWSYWSYWLCWLYCLYCLYCSIDHGRRGCMTVETVEATCRWRLKIWKSMTHFCQWPYILLSMTVPTSVNDHQFRFKRC